MGAKICLLGMIMYFAPYLRSVMVRFPFCMCVARSVHTCFSTMSSFILYGQCTSHQTRPDQTDQNRPVKTRLNQRRTNFFHPKTCRLKNISFGSKLFKLVKNNSKWFKWSQTIYQSFQHFQMWSKIFQYSSKYFKIVKNGLK